jgi:stringent starvation protein B
MVRGDSMQQTSEPTSTRPYLIRAWHEWCCDNGLTPYVTVAVDNLVQVPREYVKDDEIVLNIGFDATTSLSIGNDYLEFKARFSGVVRDIMAPIDHVLAIFARENGQGMTFPSIRRVDLQAMGVSEKDSSQESEADASGVQGKGQTTRLSSVAAESNLDSRTVSTQSQSAPKIGVRPTLTRIK